MPEINTRFEVGDRVTDNIDVFSPEDEVIVLGIDIKVFGSRYAVEYLVGEIDPKDACSVLRSLHLDDANIEEVQL